MAAEASTSDGIAPRPRGDRLRTWIEARDLWKSYGDLEVLRGASIEVGPGITLLSGPNGVGKSTFVSLLEGLTHPSDGQIKVAGIVPGMDPVRLMQSVAFLPERPAFLSGSSVGEHLRYAAGMRNIRVSNMLDLCNYFRIARLIDIRPMSLSQGEAQLVSLCTVLAADTPSYVLDEPNANLDVENRTRLASLIHRMSHADGKNFLVTTHIADEILASSDTVVPMIDGVFGISQPTRSLFSDKGSALIVIHATNTDAVANALEQGGIPFSVDGAAISVRGVPIRRLLSAIDPAAHFLTGVYVRPVAELE